MISNSLYYGDNLDILRRYVQTESVDLIYLDHPFKGNQTYNVLLQEKDGSQSASQIKAFANTWYWACEIRIAREAAGATDGGHLTKRRQSCALRAVRMAARGSQRPFHTPALSCSVQLRHTLAQRQGRGAKASE